MHADAIGDGIGLNGHGLSQLESWDPKPGTVYGGPFRAIPTSVPGIHISELLPHTAKIADDITRRARPLSEARTFVDSRERHENLTRQLYQRLLGRAPSAAELNALATDMDRGLSERAATIRRMSLWTTR